MKTETMIFDLKKMLVLMETEKKLLKALDEKRFKADIKELKMFAAHGGLNGKCIKAIKEVYKELVVDNEEMSKKYNEIVFKKVAKLITFSLTTRVIVNDDAEDDEIIAAAYSGIQDKIDNRELGDNCTEIEDDEEVPFGEGIDDEQ
mgnify:CR=1 FL=1